MLTLTELKEKIIHTARSCGISDIGFADFCSLSEYFPPDSGSDVIHATHAPQQPAEENAKSIIVYVCSYFAGNEPGNISRYARGRDYHIVMKELGEPILRILEENGFGARCLCDSSPLPERFLAQRAGLGFCGKNHSFIHPVYGSYVFIGCIVTDCPLPPDAPCTGGCAECGRCSAECPSGALADGGFDGGKCISQLTQKKGELTQAEEALIKKSGYAWGCDICQQVCPHNAHIPLTVIPEFRENLTYNLPDVSELSGRQFKKLYSGSAFSWRGKSVIMRNLSLFTK